MSSEHKTMHGTGQAPLPENAGGERREFAAPGGGKPRRLDAFLSEALRGEGVSREKIKQAILKGRVTLNGAVCVKPTAPVRAGDAVTAALPAPAAGLAPERGDLAVLWRDEHLAVLDKPANLTVHPAPGRPEGTLAHRLLHHFPDLARQGGLRPGIVHRLDKDTSGLMLVALTEKARIAMTEAFAKRAVKKEYLALVHGVPPKSAGSVISPIGRSPVNKTKMAVVPLAKGGKEARSDYTVLHADPEGRFSLVRVAIHTGRTHQIRVHMQSIGHPLIGDAAYGTGGLPPLPAPGAARQMLHAFSLAFTHPVTGEAMAFRLPPPEDFRGLALSLAMPMQRVVITGSPGGGKSTLTHALEDAGAPVWSADDAVRRLYAKGGDGWHMLRARYGDRFVPDEDADVDKRALFAAMSESDALRREVEQLVHPLVFHGLNEFWHAQASRGIPLAAAEIPLALESGRYDPANRPRNAATGSRGEILAGVWCPFAKRRERMKATRGWSDETVARMESWQWPETKKARSVDLVVDNSGDLPAMQRRSAAVLGVLAFLRRQAEKRLAAYFAGLWRQ